MGRSAKLRTHLIAVLILVLAPLCVLGQSLFGDRTYLPYDLATHPPLSTQLSAEAVAAYAKDSNLDPTELPLTFVPKLRVLRDHVVDGRLPHWDPHTRSGTTFWASSLLGVTYPPNWLLLFYGDPVDGLALLAWLGFALAGLLMYGLLNEIGLRPTSAIFGALVFALCGTMAVNAHFYQRMHALLWLPGMLWAVLCIARGSSGKRNSAVICLALCFYMSLTAGFPIYAIVNGLIAGAYTLWLCLISWRRSGLRPAIGLGAVVFGATLLGVAAAAVQIGPALGFFPHSNRPPTDGASLPQVYDLYGLLGYLCPDIISHPHLQHGGTLPYASTPLGWLLQNRDNGSGGYFLGLNYNFTEYTVFVGSLTLLLAVIGVCTRGPRFRIFATVGFFGLLLLACGGVWIQGLLGAPPFSFVPPIRYLAPACALLAALAAIGLENLAELRRGLAIGIAVGAVGIAGIALFAWFGLRGLSGPTFGEALLPHLQAKYQPQGVPVAEIQKELNPIILGNALDQLRAGLLRITAVFFACGLLFAFLPRLIRRLPALQLVIVLVTCAELLFLAAPLNQGRHLAPTRTTPIHEFLNDRRLEHLAEGGFTVARAYRPSKPDALPAAPFQLPPGGLLELKIRDLHGYAFVDGRSHLPMIELWGAQQMASGFWPLALPDDERLQRPYLDLLGVRYLLSETPLQFAGKQVGPHLRNRNPPKGYSDEFFVYERPHPMPRGFVVHRLQVVQDPDGTNSDDNTDGEIARLLVQPDFKPRQVALIDQTTADQMAKAGLRKDLSNASASSRQVRFVPKENPDELELQVTSGKPGYLIMNDTWMPGWTASVNGAVVPNYRVNLFQRMVPIPGDGATVRFVYNQPGFAIGLGITIGAFVIMAMLGLGLATSRRSPEPVEQAL